MGGRTLFLWLTLMVLFAVIQSKKNGISCTKWKTIEYERDSISLLCGGESLYTFSNNDSEGTNTKDFKGTYTLQRQCKAAKDKIIEDAKSSYSHKLIILGTAVALLLILLLIVTGGLVWTCWILRKTTEISIKPKSSARVLHQYNELPLQPDNSASFQPSINYSLLNSKHDSSHFSQSQLSRSEMEEEEQIYEVLDGEDNRLETAKASGVKRGVAISGDKNGPYSKLEYSENLQDN